MPSIGPVCHRATMMPRHASGTGAILFVFQKSFPQAPNTRLCFPGFAPAASCRESYTQQFDNILVCIAGHGIARNMTGHPPAGKPMEI